MRNWNEVGAIERLQRNSSFQRTYEELKLIDFFCVCCRFRRFQRTYEELKLYRQAEPGLWAVVFSVPMRNWNSFIKRGMIMGYYRFQRTYEELKLDLVDEYSSLPAVFSVPMRNWNDIMKNLTGYSSLFSAYLWGIETHSLEGHSCALSCFQRTYEELKPSSAEDSPDPMRVFSVPMRNWNQLIPMERNQKK